MADGFYTLPSFPSGKGLPFPLPPSQGLNPLRLVELGLPVAIFSLFLCPSFFHRFFDAFLDRFLVDFPPQLGPQNPLRVRLRPARACQSGEAHRCSLFLHCTLTSHITLFFLYLFKVGDLQVPCDSSRAEWWGFGTPKNWRRRQKRSFGDPFFHTFFENA